jgi:hypothetical protein
MSPDLRSPELSEDIAEWFPSELITIVVDPDGCIYVGENAEHIVQQLTSMRRAGEEKTIEEWMPAVAALLIDHPIPVSSPSFFFGGLIAAGILVIMNDG